ncbi:hypothetical protein B0T10DRAFT_467515 [Thelonectria olida]|uniref:Uncharacterized protein n=1 Tax=Thelonectria olida TaxID=1576542 RepID=A0A9P9AI05_9HYPO|nr:hypothetical protein B0T10DRAFT_467515 [Thelonectria olida]
MQHEVTRPHISISEEELNEVRQCMRDGDALNAHNEELRHEIQEIRHQQNQINSYETTYRQVIDTQDELIKSLSSSIVALNQNQNLASSTTSHVTQAPPAPSPASAESPAAPPLYFSDGYSAGFQGRPDEARASMQPDERRPL